MGTNTQVEAQLVAMQRQIDELTSELQRLRGDATAPREHSTTSHGADGGGATDGTSRRQLIRRGALAVGSGLALGAAGSRQAAAADGDPVLTSQSVFGTGTTRVQSSGSAADGLYGEVTSPTGATWGVRGESDSNFGRGVRGRARSATGIAHGVEGVTQSADGVGVRGANESTGDEAVGIRGETAGGFDAIGIHGEATNTDFVVSEGVRGTSRAVFGTGVIGEAVSDEPGSKYGVFGNVLADTGEACGVFGQVFSPEGFGVEGFNGASSGPGLGVFGKTDAAHGTAVRGEAVADDESSTVGVEGIVRSSFGVGVFGSATNNEGGAWGVLGETASPEGVGVYGRADGGGSGVVGLSDDGFGAQLIGGRAAAWLAPRGSAPRTRTDRHSAGEVIVDTNSDAWLCVASGTPGEWRKLAGPGSAGSVHMLNPYRAYDSRVSDGALAQGASRVVSVKDGRDTQTGAVNAADVLPAGATGVFFNLTVTATTGLGFLATTPGDASEAGASSINWGGDGVTAANGTTVQLDSDRQLKVFAGGTPNATTQFIVDITGYTL